MPYRQNRKQRGVFLLEALIGIVIFSIGVLAMVGLQARAIDIQTDTQYRIEAANFTTRMLGEISLAVDRSSAAAIQGSLAAFSHRTTTAGPCNFTGADSTNALVVAWLDDIANAAGTRLPGSVATRQQILVDTGTFNRVSITVCWQTGTDAVPRRHTLVSYVN